MTAGFAIDTNIAVYAFVEDPNNAAAMLLLEAGPRISVQLLNEFTNVSLRKRNIPWPEIDESIAIIGALSTSIRPVDVEVHRVGRGIARRYRLGLYDSMIIAAAILDDCDILFSEDLHHGLVIDDRLTIINPFVDIP